MIEPLNLTELKRDLTQGIRADLYGTGWYLDRPDLLALIDIAEAAHDYARHHLDLVGEDPAATQAADYSRLHDALTKVTP